MDKLYESARTGNVDELRELVIQNPLILHSVALSFVDNPLHMACLTGHLDFVKELLMLKPEFAKELNSEGYTPMHMASANGHVEIVRELTKIDHQLCRIRDINGRTPFHLAVLKGKVSVVKEIADQSIEDLTQQGETAMHLAVRYGQFESFSIMVDCIRTMNKDGILNKRDEQGNTVLHLATSKKQRQVVELLLANKIGSSQGLDVNAVNHSGLTSLDILLIFPSEAGDREMQELLQRAGGLRAQDPDSSFPPTLSQTCTTRVGSPSRLVDYFKFHRGRDSPSSVRDALLVIAVLVATATYQVGINPPGGTWQDDNRSTSSLVKQHMAGRSIMGTYSSLTYTVFAAFNSIGFTLSLVVIGILTSKFPLRVEFQVCLLALYVTYNTSVVYLAPDSVKVFIIVFTSVLPTLVPVVAKLWRRYAS